MAQKIHLNADEPEDPYPLYGTTPIPPKKPGVVRVWVDGCFDMLHFGHTNALRQAAALGHELFVGSHTDEEIMKYKGPPIMSAEERYEALRACKFVTYVVENYPYVTRVKDLKRFEVDFCAHGDDISTDENGRNSYQEVIDAGMFKVFKRTAGISTTDLVGRMLLCTKEHMISGEPTAEHMAMPTVHAGSSASLHYRATSSKIVQFSNNRQAQPEDTVVYVDGAFDLFHIGHMRVLEKARQQGTYLIVGIHDDSVVNDAKGVNYPIMNLMERVLGVLSCRFVDEVIMGVPFEVTEDIIKTFNVQIVVAGSLRDGYADSPIDPYAIPRSLGIFREVPSDCNLTVAGLIQRIVSQHQAFLARQAKKAVKDKKAEENKPKEYANVREL